MKIRFAITPLLTKRIPQKHGTTLRTLLRRTCCRKAKTQKYTRSLARSLYLTILLAALKATVNKGIQSKGTRDKAAIDHVEVTVMGGPYHIRVLTAREGSEGMQVLHVTTCTCQDRIFHTLIVESDMMRAHDPRGLQKRLHNGF